MDKVSNEEYQKAWETINKCKEQNKAEKAKELHAVISKYENTYWKKTESMLESNYFHIIGKKTNHNGNEGGHFEVIRYASYTNGLVKINREYLDTYSIEEFLGRNLARQSDMFSDDEDEQTCHCPQIESPHWKDQHTGLEQIEREQFNDEVKLNVLDKMAGGLTFG